MIKAKKNHACHEFKLDKLQSTSILAILVAFGNITWKEAKRNFVHLGGKCAFHANGT